MFVSADLPIVITFLIVQWHITRMLLRAAKGRLLARAAIVLFDVVLVAGYAVTYSALLSWLRVPGRALPLIGAATFAYLLIATVAVTVRAVERKINPQRRRLLSTGAKIIMASPALALGYGTFIERSKYQVREIDVPMPGLAPALDNFQILQLSDIHLGAFLSLRELDRVIGQAREFSPRIAVVTGDLISSRGDPLDECLRRLTALRSDAGVFGCLGNHERYADAEDYAQEAGARLGIRFLRAQQQSLQFGGATLNLAGVDYEKWSDRDHYLEEAKHLVIPGATNILLSHNPDVFPTAVRQGYNLVLSGHTHGGQITIEILDRFITPARFFTPYIYGLYRNGAAAAYVTRGIGTIGLPTRIGAPPEIALLRLRKV